MALGHRPRTFTGATDGAWAWPRVTDRPALVLLIPFVFAAAYFVVFIAQLPHNLWVIGWNSDYASGFTIPATLVETGTGGHTVLSTTGAYLPLWFGLLTATLPLHRELWELAPTGLFLLTALAVGWSVAQIASRGAATLATLLILVASPRALYIFMAPVAHNTVYPGTALLGAYLVWLARARARRAVTWAVALLAGVALGTCIASDSLLIVTGAIPFALTAVLAGVSGCRRSRTLMASAFATVAVAIPIAELTSRLMGSLGYATLPPSTEIASLSTLPRHAELMWEGLKGLFNGYLRQAPSGGVVGSGLGVACEIVMIVALITMLIVGVLTAAKFVWSGLRRGTQTPPTDPARSVHIIYWTGSAAATCVGFALSTRTEYVHESYYATLIFSVAAVIVVVTRSRSAARWLVSVGASVFFAASLVGLTSHYMERYVLPIARSYMTIPYVPAIARYQSQITAFAEANRAELGFAGYGDASSLTWSSAERILVRPVQVCANPQGADICPFFLARVPSWYSPSQQRTFLLVDSGESFLSSLPQDLGRPLAAEAFGPVQMYVYRYDIASRMGPASD